MACPTGQVHSTSTSTRRNRDGKLASAPRGDPCPSLTDYVTLTGSTSGATVAGDRKLCLRLQRPIMCASSVRSGLQRPITPDYVSLMGATGGDRAAGGANVAYATLPKRRWSGVTRRESSRRARPCGALSCLHSFRLTNPCRFVLLSVSEFPSGERSMLLELALLVSVSMPIGVLAVEVADRPDGAMMDAAADRQPTAIYQMLAKGGGGRGAGGSKGTRTSTRGQGGYQSTGEGGFRSTGEGGFRGGSGETDRPVNHTPPNNPMQMQTAPAPRRQFPRSGTSATSRSSPTRTRARRSPPRP